MDAMSNAAVLVIEDNEDDAFFMDRALNAAGITCPIHTVRDGQAAIDYLSGQGAYRDRREWPLPGVIFLDLKLPLIPGLNVLEWIRQQAELDRVVVIVLTVSHEPIDLNRAYQIGANAAMVKPPTAQQVTELARAFKLWNHCRASSGEKIT